MSEIWSQSQKSGSVLLEPGEQIIEYIRSYIKYIVSTCACLSAGVDVYVCVSVNICP